MSTPSTATAILPQPHQHYPYSRHQDYHVRDPRANGYPSGTGIGGGGSNNPLLAVNVPARLGSTHQQQGGQQHHNFSTNTATTTTTNALTLTNSPSLSSESRNTEKASQNDYSHHHSAMVEPARGNASIPTTTSASRKRQREPNWSEYYRNGLPREVIVIDDDSPPPTGRPAASAATTNYSTLHLSGRDDMKRSYPDNDASQPATKKRRTAATSTTGAAAKAKYDYTTPTNNQTKQQQSQSQSQFYATNGTLQYDISPSISTGSTDRTTSAIHTTAATSLGSHYSQGASTNGYKPASTAQAAGAKRKRTRKAVADEAKRIDIENQGDAYNTYVPPPKPPIKAKDVVVPLVHDTSAYKNSKVDDNDGHYVVYPDIDITNRYRISKLLGQGTFGKVVEAYDKIDNKKVAIKIIRSVQKYRDASRIELRVLSTLSQNDEKNRNKCIHLRDCFDFRNHICIVTDLLGMSVFDFLKSNQFVPFPSSQIQSFARQLFTSVAFLHDLNLIHTDLKPENILLVQNHYQTFTYNRQVPTSSTNTNRVAKNRRVLLDPDIRLIDFGSATFEEEYHSSVVSTRHYRAPEIILSLGWSYPCDIWSIGCILVEFFTGDALFQTHDNLEHLAMMESVCGGKIESKLIRQVLQSGRGNHQNPAAKYFVNSRRLDYPNKETSRASKRYVNAMKPLQDIIPTNINNKFNEQFLDLLRKIFLYDPAKRITAKEALKHPWFRESIFDDGTEANKIRLEREREAQSYQSRGHEY